MTSRKTHRTVTIGNVSWASDGFDSQFISRRGWHNFINGGYTIGVRLFV